MDRLLRIAGRAACWAALAAPSSALAEPAGFIMRATVDGRVLEGRPLAWSAHEVVLLGRDGALHQFAADDARDAVKTGRDFLGYTTAEMAARLRAEFDRSFEVAATRHYVVVHPRGPWRAWAERLETLYGSFTHAMSVRGFDPQPPATPLVAVVFRNRDEYFAHAAASGVQLHDGTLGHYDPTTNRVLMFDAGDADADAEGPTNVATIIHEATHQAAYNIGVHQRFAEQPRWAVEGLAMMFETPGLLDASSLRPASERLNRGRLEDFRRRATERPADWLVQLVASDARFQSDALAAYAEAWTLSFYLFQSRPQQYCDFLARAAARTPFTTYPPAERMARLHRGLRRRPRATHGAGRTLRQRTAVGCRGARERREKIAKKIS